MEYNNKYTKIVDKLDTSDEFKNKLIEKIKEEDYKKGLINMKIKNKITAIIATLGIIVCGGVAYATVVPQEWKDNVNHVISSFFFGKENEQENESTEFSTGIQDKTIENVLTSEKENIEKYSQLIDADVYGIGDSNGGTLVESNYAQYDWDIEYDEDGNALKKPLQKYSDIINIKLGMVNYTCLENFGRENTILDENGNVIERKESTIEEELEYQYNEFTTNWNDYYYGEEKFEDKLYFKITGMTLMNGNNISEEDYYNNARAKKIKVTFNGEKEEIINLSDTMQAQFIDLEYLQNDISKPVDITVEVLETYAGNTSNDTYIADIQFGINSNIPMGR